VFVTGAAYGLARGRFPKLAVFRRSVRTPPNRDRTLHGGPQETGDEVVQFADFVIRFAFNCNKIRRPFEMTTFKRKNAMRIFGFDGAQFKIDGVFSSFSQFCGT